MTINTLQELFSKLLETTTPSGVKEILSSIGDVSDIGLNQTFGNLKLHWHPYGGKTSNYSTIGLASKPGRSITERITNAIDAIIEERALNTQTKPTSPQQAVNEWFGRPYSNAETGLFSWKYSEGGYDRKIGVILSDSGKDEAPTVDILDFGVGIRSIHFPTSILSLQEGNKITKKFLVGAFGQGGSSTLAFSEYVLIVSRHVENSEDVSFTLIKEISLGDDYKENCYAYLASTSEEGTQVIPNFALDNDLSLYPGWDKLRLNDLKNGTLVRHYAFRLTGIAKAIGPREGNLYHYLHFSLFDPLLPFQIIDLRREGEKANQQISTGSRNRLMKLVSKSDTEIDNSNSECKLYRPFVYIRPYGAETECVKIEYWVVFNQEKKKNKKTGEDYYDLRSDSNSLYVQKRHPAILTLNGQNQGELTTSQVSKDLGLDLVCRHLIVHIDVTEAPKTVKNQLFTTNRETLKDGDVLESIKQELKRILAEDSELKAIDNELVERATSEVTQSTDNEVKKQIVSLLREAGFTPSAEGDATRKGDGKESPDPPPPPPPPPSPPPPPPVPLATLPYPHVSRLEIVSPKGKLAIPLNRTGNIKIETDADSQFKEELRLKVEPDSIEIASYFPLHGGRAKWRLRTTENSKIGDKGKVTVTLTLPNGDQLKAQTDYEILEQIAKPSKEEKGFIPDFEVIPTTPGDENWNKAWENISEDSEEVTSVAYIPKKFGLKTIVYYSTVFDHYKTTIDKLTLSRSPLANFFDLNYKVWIGYHAILQLNSHQSDTTQSDDYENRMERERENERSLVAQMQVKQALKSAELMLTNSKQSAASHVET
jgi:hypothetical protein